MESVMDTMTAAEAKQKFGQLIDKAQRGPVEITKHGRRVGVFVSDDWYAYDEYKKQTDLVRDIALSREQLINGEGRPAEEVYARLREKLKTWKTADDLTK